MLAVAASNGYSHARGRDMRYKIAALPGQAAQ